MRTSIAFIRLFFYVVHKGIVCRIILLKQICIFFLESESWKHFLPFMYTSKIPELILVGFPSRSCTSIIDIMSNRNKCMHKLIFYIMIPEDKVPSLPQSIHECLDIIL